MFKISPDGILIKYEGSDSDIVVPDNVRVIGDDAFRKNAFVQKVSLPGSLRHIDSFAFEKCYNLHTVSFCGESRNLEIAPYAFANCISLKNIALHGVVKISEGAFLNCQKLRSVAIPEHTIVEGASFVGCNLDNVDFGTRTDFSSIEDGCLLRDGGRCILCHGILENVPSEGGRRCGHCGVIFNYRKMCDWDSYVIENKALIEYVGSGTYLPEGIEIISERAFDDRTVSGLEMLDSDITEIEDEAFLWCDFALMPDLPRKLKKLGERAFSGSNITRIMLPAGLEFIGNACFSYCEHLKEVHIPHTVHTIGRNCFKGCDALTAAHLPNHFKNQDLSEVFPRHTKLVFEDVL